MKVKLLHNLGSALPVSSHLAGDVIDVDDQLGAELLRRLLAEVVEEPSAPFAAVPAAAEVRGIPDVGAAEVGLRKYVAKQRKGET